MQSINLYLLALTFLSHKSSAAPAKIFGRDTLISEPVAPTTIPEPTFPTLSVPPVTQSAFPTLLNPRAQDAVASESGVLKARAPQDTEAPDATSAPPSFAPTTTDLESPVPPPISSAIPTSAVESSIPAPPITSSAPPLTSDIPTIVPTSLDIESLSAPPTTVAAPTVSVGPSGTLLLKARVPQDSSAPAATPTTEAPSVAPSVSVPPIATTAIPSDVPPPESSAPAPEPTS